jgi:hypothetical protein
MSDASYGFLSVLRRGLAARIGDDAPTEPRANIAASFQVAGQAVAGLPEVALAGPGDIVGFDAGSVRRTWPTSGATDAEPNYFPLVELAQADLPWRYTPVPTSGERLTPWLCLVVVKDSEIAPLLPATRDRPLAVLTVNDPGALPDLEQAWAWAHAQLVGAQAPVTAESVAALLAASPHSACARLLCPRRLEPQTAYLACVVPVFERGRLAGLGKPVTGVERNALAWPRAMPLQLPVYFSWRFQTGEAGDFAALVHKLTALHDVPPEVWQRDLAVAPPAVVPPSWEVAKLLGALVPLGAPPVASTQSAFSEAIAALINAAGARELAPPLYGRWLAKTAHLATAPGATPPWFHELNADATARVAAGLGTAVVQAEEQALLAQAWSQVDNVRRANQQLRLSQLAREVATRVYERHFAVAGDAALQLTAPVHARLRAGETTVSAKLASSPIPRGAISATWRRATRQLGSLRLRQGHAATNAPSAIARMNTGALALVPMTVTAAPATPPSRLSVLLERLTGGMPLETLELATTDGNVDPDAFRHAATALLTQLQRTPRADVEWVSVDLAGIHQTVVDQLHPKRTIEQPLAARVTGLATGPKRTDALEPVMTAPEFPQAMYEPLRSLSQSWILPGLDKMPANKVSVLSTNWAFVEAFLVGLNHEMARKLLWNGYPTDQRGTYFRTFWDTRGTTGDVGPIHTWSGALGANRQGADPLVLLVRGDVVRRYPNMIVYAAKSIVEDGVRKPGPTELQPTFFARLDPDVALFGFDLDSEAARSDPGWFFVLQEHPSEPRFGLGTAKSAWGEPPPTWPELRWDHLAANAGALGALRHINLAAALPKPAVGADPMEAVWHVGDGARSGDIAHITYRQPQRLAFHASLLVPERSHP